MSNGKLLAPISRRDLLKIAAAGSMVASPSVRPRQAVAAGAAGSLAQRRACSRIAGARFNLSGWIGGYLGAVSEQWLKVAPSSNPAILDMFRDRDREPKRELLSHSGEYAGKYLTSAVQMYRVTGDLVLRQLIAEFVTQFVSLQAEDGYLGPWPKGNRLTGSAPNVRLFYDYLKGEPFDTFRDFRKTWDAWGHYHAMVGLILWFDETGDASALACARRIGDLLCDRFEHMTLVDLDTSSLSSTEMNQAPIHSLCLLYERTANPRYLKMATKICDEFGATDDSGKPLAGNYLNGVLAGKEFYELPRPRWEGLHPVMGLAELYTITGHEKSREAFESIWWSIVKGDRHNNGGFSSSERAVGNPYNKGVIETCCTIAWMALSVEMLRLTRNSIVADELEFSTLNSVVGLHSPNGRWVTYNTPMDGVRKASTQEVFFQAREGCPELSCCSCNGARGFGMISDWALMSGGGDVILNWYGPGSISSPMRRGELMLTQETEYPRDNHVKLTMALTESQSFALRLRIPYWSKTTLVHLNGKAVPKVEAGQYLTLERYWKSGDEIEITFDFSLQYWVGEREYDSKVSVYRGPILLTYDRRFNSIDPDQIPVLDARGLTGRLIMVDQWFPPMLLVEFEAIDGRALRLCDFASAGVGGSPYRSWLSVASCDKTEFSRSNPRRSGLVT